MHASHRIKHGFVHVDVDDLCAILDLLSRNCDGLVILLFANQTCKHFAAGDVRTLTDVDEKRGVVNVQGLKARQSSFDCDIGHGANWKISHFLSNGFNMLGRRTATATDHIDETCASKFLKQT